MSRWLFALLATMFVALPLLAEDKKEEKKEEKKEDKKDVPTGQWTREIEGGAELKLDFTKKDEMKMTVSANGASLLIEAKYKLEKDGTVKATATKVEKMGDFPVDIKKDFECSFKIKIDGKTAKVSDYTANDSEEQGKHAVEGEYKKVEDK
jgi:hypothetical protein